VEKGSVDKKSKDDQNQSLILGRIPGGLRETKKTRNRTVIRASNGADIYNTLSQTMSRLTGEGRETQEWEIEMGS